jgi:hypothetical protein
MVDTDRDVPYGVVTPSGEQEETAETAKNAENNVLCDLCDFCGSF